MWQIIDEFPDYEVSMHGDVRSHLKKGKTTAARRESPYVMTGFRDKRGYHSVMLRRRGDKKIYRRLVHRLVAISFIPNPDGLSDVAHGDGDPANNILSNLRWATHADNQMDMRAHGTMQDGEKSCTAKLSAEQVGEIRQIASSMGRGSGVFLAKKFGVSKAQISRIVNGARWRSTI